MKFLTAAKPTEIYNKMNDYYSHIDIMSEEVELIEAEDRYIYMDIVSQENIPEFRRSTVDGYAIKISDTVGASENIPAFFEYSGEVDMGKKTEITVKSGKCVYVPTGGMIPEGADGVVMVEYAEQIDENLISIFRPSAYNENIVEIAEDMKKGDIILQKGQKIGTYEIGVLGALGIWKVKVYQKPKFAVISTGDEIIEPYEKVEYGQIRDINSYILKSQIEKFGGEVISREIVKDDLASLRNSIEKYIGKCHGIVISGGSSAGVKDVTADVLNSFGEPGVFIHGAAIKPGKPTILAYAEKTALIGLPGHPVSASIVFDVFGGELIRILLNKMEKLKPFIESKALENIHASPGKETYQIVSIEEKNNQYYFKPIYGKSGLVSQMINADGYIIIGVDEEGISKGENRKVYLF